MGWKPPSEIRIDGDSAFVTLTRGMEAIIDLDDIPLVEPYRWCASVYASGHAYAMRSENSKGVLMHRHLLVAPKELIVDHRDGNGLNNRRSNIRLGTQKENQANKRMERRNQSGFKGVAPHGNRFRAIIKPDGRTIYLGSYDTAAEAAAAYKGAARVLWGEFAKD